MVIIYNSADKRKQKILIRKLNGNSLQFGRKKKTDRNKYETSQKYMIGKKYSDREQWVIFVMCKFFFVYFDSAIIKVKIYLP